MRIALGVEYDGRAYSGWQYQGHAPSVQQVAEAAVGRVAAATVRLQCAGRTDAGVHATGQVAHFDTEARRSARAWVLGTNVNLPADVSVRWACEVDPGFHARFSATGREYRYLILNRFSRDALAAGRATWECRPLDARRMHDAAQSLVGRHDFSAFRAAGCQAHTPVRNVTFLEVSRSGALITLRVRADAFLQHMVRNIAGVLIRIGAGLAPVHWAREVLDGRDRRLGAVTAPPDGLYLTRVFYPGHFGLPADGEGFAPEVMVGPVAGTTADSGGRSAQ
ncbi:MAG: tRNA pseudouridine(38-40) synthase TruA [Gammaproteobacteria bacterium]